NVVLYSIYGSEEYLPMMEETRDRAIVSLKEALGIRPEDLELINGRIWPTIACHSGPAVFGLACYGEKNGS
ncbi:MAG TPA: DegV family protein, partial [Mesotoga sp.]|nr:DegV family protein [Mesotoga sp.]